MQTSEKLTLKMAENIAEAVLSYARKQDMMPLTVAILDRGGHLVTFLREDDSSIMRPDIAIGKAWGSLGMGVNTRLLRDRLADRPAFQNALSVASGGRVIPVPGGVLIKNQQDKIMGAVGVSGDTSDKDEACAIHGIRETGLSPDPAEADPNWKNSGL